jgi:hypothetical protein
VANHKSIHSDRSANPDGSEDDSAYSVIRAISRVHLFIHCIAVNERKSPIVVHLLMSVVGRSAHRWISRWVRMAWWWIVDMMLYHVSKGYSQEISTAYGGNVRDDRLRLVDHCSRWDPFKLQRKDFGH